MDGKPGFLGPKKTLNDMLDELVEFGPETEITTRNAAVPVPGEVTNRLEKLLKRVQELRKRIDDLDEVT